MAIQSIQSIKKLLKSNNVSISDEEIRNRVSQIGLDLENLGEDGIAKIVDSFVSHSSNNGSLSIDLASQSKALSQRIRKDINEFEMPLKAFSDKVSSDEAFRIYEQLIAGIPDKVVAKTSDLIASHQGDPKRCAESGNAIAESLFADFYASQE